MMKVKVKGIMEKVQGNESKGSDKGGGKWK